MNLLTDSTVTIWHNQSAESPREWGNISKMACWHGSYNLGDEDAADDLLEAIRTAPWYCVGWEEYGEFERNFENPKVLLDTAIEVGVIAAYQNLYLYDHGGITMSTSSFSCRWDSGQVGFIYLLKKDVRKEYGIDRISKAWVTRLESWLDGEVETYDDYIRGNVFGFTIDDGTDSEDSCGGFYGYDPKTNGMFDHIPPELHTKAAEAFDNIQYS